MTRHSDKWQFDSLKDLIGVTDQHVAQLDTRLDTLSKKIDVLLTMVDTLSSVRDAARRVRVRGNPHMLSEAWWIIQPERGANRKVGLAYWGPFQSEVAAKESPLWNPKIHQRCLHLTNPPVTGYRT